MALCKEPPLPLLVGYTTDETVTQHLVQSVSELTVFNQLLELGNIHSHRLVKASHPAVKSASLNNRGWYWLVIFSTIVSKATLPGASSVKTSLITRWVAGPQGIDQNGPLLGRSR